MVLVVFIALAFTPAPLIAQATPPLPVDLNGKGTATITVISPAGYHLGRINNTGHFIVIGKLDSKVREVVVKIEYAMTDTNWKVQHDVKREVGDTGVNPNPLTIEIGAKRSVKWKLVPNSGSPPPSTETGKDNEGTIEIDAAAFRVFINDTPDDEDDDVILVTQVNEGTPAIGISQPQSSSPAQPSGKLNVEIKSPDSLTVEVAQNNDDGQVKLAQAQVISGTGRKSVDLTGVKESTARNATKISAKAQGFEVEEDLTVVKAAVTAADICADKITFDVLPVNLPASKCKFIVKGTTLGKKTNVIMIEKHISGGRNQTEKFDWSKFPQTPGQEFKGASVEFQKEVGKKTLTDTKVLAFTGYGKFRITKYYTPRDSDFGATELSIPKDAAFGSTTSTVLVNKDWAFRVSRNEGVGEFDGKLVLIRSKVVFDKITKIKTRNYRMLTTEGGGSVGEGKWRNPLSADTSVAKHINDGRFAKHDMVYLDGITTNCHSVDDTGNWDTTVQGKKHALDKFNGRGGPTLADGDFGTVYTLKVPMPK